MYCQFCHVDHAVGELSGFPSFCLFDFLSVSVKIMYKIKNTVTIKYNPSLYNNVFSHVDTLDSLHEMETVLEIKLGFVLSEAVIGKNLSSAVTDFEK